MARQVLDRGVIIPAEYSDDWFEDMSTNLNKLDEVIGSDAGKLSEADVSNVALSGDYDDLTNKPYLKPVATSGDYDDLTNKPSYGILRMTSETLSDSGSGAISNLNSDSKLAAGDYVLDAALKVFLITAVSALNYTVGTALFQVTDASSLAAVATSGSYDDLNNLPAYGITRFVNAAITDNSNVAFASISSVDKIKAGDFLLDNAGKMYLIASIDSVNETAAVTTPLTRLAVDSGVVHNSGNEDVNGTKTFKDMIPIDGDYLGNEGSNNHRTNICLRANRDTAGKSCAYISRFRQNKPQGALQTGDLQWIGFDVLENEVRTNNVLSIQCKNWLDNIPQKVDIISTVSSYSYGNSARKALFNNLNPGALSFPDLSNGVDISGYLSSGASTDDTYTALADGYISVIFSSSTPCGCYVYNYADGVFQRSNSITDNTYSNVCGVFMPIMKNQTLNIASRQTNDIVSARFFPCKGNV